MIEWQPAKWRLSSGKASRSTAPETRVAGTLLSAARRAATSGRLAEQRLCIAAALAGDQPVRAVERGIEAEQVGDDFCPGAKLAAKEQQGKAQTAGGACAGLSFA